MNEKCETFEISDTQRYKMCGNGVVSKVVEEVVEQLII
jgi:site-specific DNA-cytosine methylase